MDINANAVANFSGLVCLLFALLIDPCSARAAEMPTLLGQREIPAPATTIRATPDGRRLAVQLESIKDGPGEIEIVDTSNPAQPVLLGHLEIERNGEMAISPDGKSLLLAVLTEKPALAKPGRYQLTAIDITAPQQPKQIWQRLVAARDMALAPDATAYAFSRPTDGSQGKWEIAINWADRQGEPAVVPLEYLDNTSKMSLAAQGKFLAYERGGLLVIDDLRQQPALSNVQKSRGLDQDACLIALLDSGHLLVEDQRAPAIGVYASADGVPRLARIAYGDLPSGSICQLQLAAAVDGTSLVTDDAGRLYQVDTSQPEHPRLSRIWRLPSSMQARAVDATGHLFAIQAKDGKNAIAVYDLARPKAITVDWKSLEHAWNTAIRIYADKTLNEYVRAPQAIEKFDKADPMLAVDAPVEGVSSKTAAAILNDYGFLLSKYQPWRRDDIAAALRRALVLDPTRVTAHLNLADFLRGTLPDISDWGKKRALMAEVTAHYKKYLELGGHKSDDISAYIGTDLESPADQDICEAIVKYTNAGRLKELISPTGIDVPVHDKRLDFTFITQGSAHVPTIYAADSATDAPLDDTAFDTPDLNDLWGGDQLGLIVYRNDIHILHYRDVDHPVESHTIAGQKTCDFKIDTIQQMSEKASEPQLCKLLATDHGPAAIAFDDTAPMTFADVAKKYGETQIKGVKLLDIGNDGHSINVGQFEQQSGAGAGCDAVFFDQVDADGAQFLSSDKRKLLIDLQGADPSNRYPILPCQNQPKFFEYNGKIYFESRPITWPPIDSWNQYHRVSRIASGKVMDVCGFSFKTTVSIDR
jgi:hypothetical protein